jgi:hypothetical protein
MRLFLFLAASAAACAVQPAPAAAEQAMGDVSRAGWDRSTPAASIRGIIAANKSGDRSWIIATFAPADRPGVAKLVSDPAMLAANSAIHKKIVSASVRNVRPYRGYAIVSVTEQLQGGKKRVVNYPLKRTPEGWLLSNDLAADDNFQPYE